MHFALDVSAAPGADAVTIVAVTGELDMASAPRLRQELVSLASAGRTTIVIDLAGVDFLDSTGLGVVLGALKRVRAAGGDLALARTEPQVAKVFEITRLSDIMPLHDTIEAAIAAVVSD
ncbi:STAS domain-containing protein [Rhabdothermincola salaria]|uniref:STAS domain-containing protein n=1 Tax=Rhabdothermincola salaria TaxID=2903142 RepID=UPI001E2B9C7F|nr:STAS domain-containing protein [Rhabdothermincola salaria]